MNSYSYGDLHKNSRSNFVSKVYSILSIQLTVTALFVFANIYIPAFAKFQDRSTMFYVLSIIGTLGTMLALGTY